MPTSAALQEPSASTTDPQAAAALEVDESEYDSGLESSDSTRSASITSSILEYEYENGRRYSSGRRGAYPLPNDEQEQDRLDLFHHIFLMLLNGSLHNAPLEPKPKRVLDIGTGTGIWAIDFADSNPEAEVVGTDISPIQPTWVPPNLKFYIEDADSDWVFDAHEAFDYIHVRGMGGSINDWEKLISQAYSNMTPGGWLEFQEPEAWSTSDDDTITRAKFLLEWQTLCNDAAKLIKREISLAPTLKQRMINAGFVDVEEKVLKVPVGRWPKDPKLKEIGRYELENLTMAVEAYTFGFIGKILKWSEEECRVLAAKVIEDFRDPKNHLYARFYFVTGRKPEA